MDIPPRPLLATADPALLDDLLRLATAASAEVDIARTAEEALRLWSRAPLALVGADLGQAMGDVDPPPHPHLVKVARATGDSPAFEHGHLLLPRDESELVGLLARAAAPARTPAPTVSVVGGRGGAGASLLAIALALAGERAEQSTALLDTDPLGCGSDVYLECDGDQTDHLTGWGDLLSRNGRVHWHDLRPRLPRSGRVSVLTWRRGPDTDPTGPLPVGAVRAVLSSARDGTDLVVVDLPRSFDPATRVLLNRSDLVLLVIPADVPAVVATTRMVSRLCAEASSVRAVVRGARGELSADVVAKSVGLPLGADLPPEPGLARTLAAGRAPARRPRSPMARFADRVVAHLPRVQEAP